MLKNKIILVAVAIAIILSSCQKESQYNDATRKAQLTIDSTIIEKYISDNKITGTLQALTNGKKNGLFYKIINPGSGPSNPDSVLTDTSRVALFYDGRVLGQRIAFDSVATTISRKFVFGNLIQGWKIGLPLIKRGGKIRLFVPSTMAYINRQVGTIPPNSVLDFNIILDSVIYKIKPINK